MSQYPRILIDLQKLRDNYNKLVDFTRPIDIVPVTKSFCAYAPIIDALIDEGVGMLADARIENLKSIAGKNVKKYLLRIPMKSELKDVAQYCDLVNISEKSTADWLNAETQKLDKIIDVLLMIELGDLREGVLKDDVDAIVNFIQSLSHVNLKGFGVNLTCYGSVIPTSDKLKELIAIADSYDIESPIISGGNSSSLYLIPKGEMPKAINQLRVGEAFILGRETAYGEALDFLHQDAFTIETQIVELKTKPTMPDGEIGVNAFGEKINYEDIGERTRAIVALGRQDVNIDDLAPLDKNIFVYGSSSDHIIIDVTGLGYKLGDIVTFNVSYGSVLSCFTSKYVKKHIK